MLKVLFEDFILMVVLPEFSIQAACSRNVTSIKAYNDVSALDSTTDLYKQFRILPKKDNDFLAICVFQSN